MTAHGLCLVIASQSTYEDPHTVHIATHSTNERPHSVPGYCRRLNLSNRNQTYVTMNQAVSSILPVIGQMKELRNLNLNHVSDLVSEGCI